MARQAPPATPAAPSLPDLNAAALPDYRLAFDLAPIGLILSEQRVVRDCNQQVLAKEYFDLPVTFPAGQDRLMVTETLEEITIPRARLEVSGSNFEVLVGFDVTPQMAAFNRDGKRFRVNATAVAAAGSPAGQ